MDIKDINRIALGENDVLWVKLDKKSLPHHSWTRYANDVKEALQLYFLTNQIIITSDDVNINIISPKQLAVIEEIINAPTST